MPPELNTLQKIREKLKEIEQASGRKLKSAAKKIIEQHALGDENKKERSGVVMRRWSYSTTVFLF